MPVRTRRRGNGDADEPKPDSTIEETLEEWKQKFQAMSDEAATYGFTAVTVLVYMDPLDKLSHMTHVRAGCFYTAVGGLECVLTQLKVPEYGE